ncbi:MAG: class I SAM-dependent methyltransferase [Salaquimonas sp.]
MSDETTQKPKRYFKSSYSLKNTDQTKAHYAKWAEVYDQEINDEKGYQQPIRCAQALLETGLSSSGLILDIGCGTGLSGLSLKAAGYTNIDGCDLSPEMLERAKATGCYQRLFETNLNEPPLGATDASYDAATCVGVFSFGHVAPDAIDEILRVLKPGGYLVIGLNDHFYKEGSFPAKLDALVSDGKIEIVSRSHGAHMANVEGSTGWVITSKKV